MLPDPSSPHLPIHTRQVTCQGYRREDGNWDIEGHLIDTKSYSFHTIHRGDIAPGEPFHEMRMRLTVTDSFEVVGIDAEIVNAPFHICSDISTVYRQLIGLTIGAGWSRAIKERLGGVRGCTHLTELLGPLATTAFQTIYPVLSRERAEAAQANPDPDAALKPVERPALLDVCHVFDTSGAFVREHWPDHYTGPLKSD